jgi:hypothetical protein
MLEIGPPNLASAIAESALARDCSISHVAWRQAGVVARLTPAPDIPYLPGS